MIGQVQIINGVKQIVPVTDTTPVDEVTVNNMQSVTSNAVAQAIAGAKPEIIDDPNITDCNNAYILGKSVVYKISKAATNAPAIVSGQFGNAITLVSYTYSDSTFGAICYQIAYIPLSNSNNNMLTYCRVGRPNISWGRWEFLNNGKINGQCTDANEAYELEKTRVYSISTSDGTNLPPSTQGVTTWLITSNTNIANRVIQIAIGSGSLISSSNITFYKAIYYRTGIYYNGMQWSEWAPISHRVYVGVISKNNSDVPTYGYWQATIPSEINNEKVLGVYLYTGSISAMNGTQITPIYCGGGTIYMTVYKPTAWSQNTINFTFRIVYEP